MFRNNSARAGAAINAGGYGADFRIRDCTFEGNYAHGNHGGAVRVHEGSPSIQGCLFVGNWAAEDGGAILAIEGGEAEITYCTFYENGAFGNGAGIAAWDYACPTISHSIVVASHWSGCVFTSNAYPDYRCNDVWGNPNGNYTGDSVDPTGTDGDISADPRFCDPTNLDLTLAADSACAPENNPECGRIGAFPVGCGAAGVEGSAGLLDRVHRAFSSPNPFRGETVIQYSVPTTPKDMSVKLAIYDVSGRLIRSLPDDRVGEGTHKATWDGIDDSGMPVSTGVYFYLISLGDQTQARSVILLE